MRPYRANPPPHHPFECARRISTCNFRITFAGGAHLVVENRACSPQSCRSRATRRPREPAPARMHVETMLAEAGGRRVGSKGWLMPRKLRSMRQACSHLVKWLKEPAVSSYEHLQTRQACHHTHASPPPASMKRTASAPILPACRECMHLHGWMWSMLRLARANGPKRALRSHF